MRNATKPSLGRIHAVNYYMDNTGCLWLVHNGTVDALSELVNILPE